MALIAGPGYGMQRAQRPGQFNTYEPSDMDSASSSLYGTEDANRSLYSSRASSSYASTALSSVTDLSTSEKLGVKKPRVSKSNADFNGFVETIFDVVYQPSEQTVTRELTASELDQVKNHWHNYDIHKSLRPRLLPDDEFQAAEKLLYGFRYFYSKVLKKRKQFLVDQRIKIFYATKIQCAMRQKLARRRKAKKMMEKKKERDEQTKYKNFKTELLNGIELSIFDPKNKTKKDCVIKVDLDDPKKMLVKMTKGGTIKFELMFLYKAAGGWTTPSFKKVPKQNRGAKDVCFSLEGKSVLDFAAKGPTPEEAKYKRDEFVSAFNLLIRELNSPSAIYRDADGNRRRVVKSVFQPSDQSLKTAKNNTVTLQQMNMAMLYKVQHRFIKHKQRIQRNQKAKHELEAQAMEEREQRQSVTHPTGIPGLVTEDGELLDVESQPSYMSGVTLMTDEKNYQPRAAGGRRGRGAAPQRIGKYEVEDNEDEASDEDSDEEDSDESDEDEEEYSSDEEEEEGYDDFVDDGDDQASETEYTSFAKGGADDDDGSSDED